MITARVTRFLTFIISTSLLFACSRQKAKDDKPPQQFSNPVVKIIATRITPPLIENFDSGSKQVYSAGTVYLTSGNWVLDNALIGTTGADHKKGNSAVRIRQNGKLRMDFDVSDGASVVTISHAKYGKDGPSKWELWLSADGGKLYKQVDSAINTVSINLQKAIFKVNRPGKLRFEIRKTSGGNTRINIDDFTIKSYADSTVSLTDSAAVTDNTNLLLGNPSGAVTSLASADNYLIDQVYYTLSYNAKQGKPNWVSWYLGSTTLGAAARKNDFRANEALPPIFYRVNEESYNGSGFDRGHNCPSADRTQSKTANAATFLMTNMMPQAPNNNQHTWADLEVYERQLVRQGNELYVVCGSYGVGGTGSRGFATAIDHGHVTVPSNIWKIIVIIPDGDNDLARIDNNTRVIAVNMPNSNAINPNWRNYLATVDDIEAATGYNLMSNVPESVQRVIEARIDIGI